MQMQERVLGWRQLLLVLSLLLSLSLAQESATCSAAIHLPPPYDDIIIVGTTANKAYADDGCSWDERSVTYRINPTIGNEVTIKSCGPAVQNDIWVTVYSGSCSSRQCEATQGLYSDTFCAQDGSKVFFVAEEEEYWVSVVSWSEGEGQFSININEGVHATPPPGCDVAVSVFGPYSPSLTIYGDVEPIGEPPTTSYVLPCTGVVATTSITWFKLYPSQRFVTVSTCNAGSEVATDVSAYAGDCSDLTCTYYSSSDCTNGSTVTLYWDYGTFYISITGRDGATGAFEMTVVESWYFDGDTPIGWDDDDGITSFSGSNHISSISLPVFTALSPLSPFPSLDLPTFSSFSDDSDTWYTWEPPADSGPGSDCSTATPATYGQSEIWTNAGLVYENMCGLYSHSASRWFVFSPTSSDRVKIDVCTSNFDTVIAVVDNCNSLSCLASNDDSCGNNASSVTMDVTSGKSYYIIVGGYSSNSGSFRLSISSA